MTKNWVKKKAKRYNLSQERIWRKRQDLPSCFYCRILPDEGFALSRSRQVTKEKMASRFLKGKWAIKKG